MAHQNALAAAQAKAKAARDALTLRLTQESNARIHNTYVNPAIAGAHANNMAMQAEAARLGAAKAAARAREKAEQEARQAEAELLAQQEAERRAAARAKAEADARAVAEADAEARLREQENRTRLSMEMNVTPPVPVYTPEMVQKAESAMIQPGIMALPFIPRMMNLSVASRGVIPMTPEANFFTGNTLIRAASVLSEWVAATETMVATATAGVLIATFCLVVYSFFLYHSFSPPRVNHSPLSRLVNTMINIVLLSHIQLFLHYYN
ncbi:hypothetical protein NQ468_004738 [Salmonella enterica]|nr:hypothetical protein [Salmonella enterica]